MNQFKKCTINDLKESFSNLIGEKYALITVFDKNNLNMMTASWGSMGIMWNKNVVNVVVRPSRYTYDFLMNNEYFTLNFLQDGNADVYKLCGSKSGRDCDKVKASGLIPIEIESSKFAFDKSEYVFVCKKLYAQPMRKEYFVSSEYGDKTYPNDDVHTMFIAELEEIYVQNN